MIIVFVIIFSFIKFINLRISNIYVTGNKYLTDQYIIELAGISNYPRCITSLSSSLEKKIMKNDYIKNVQVNKKWFTKVYISVIENRPLIYDDLSKKTVLLDGTKVDKIFDVPILVNSISSDIYMDFLEKFSLINEEVFINISEVKYVPNDNDKELFLFIMKDGNFISVNLDKFVNVNRYLDMVKKFNNKKGILYLDSGEYFKILDK